VAYIRAKNDVVEFPPQYAGLPLSEAVKNFKGVTIRTEKDGKTYVFVVKHSAYLKKVLLQPTAGARILSPSSPPL